MSALSAFFCGVLCAASPVSEDGKVDAMTNARLHQIITKIDPAAKRQASHMWALSVEGLNLLVITDARANRMRVMTPVGEAKALPPKLAQRMLQANFDSALDARYAIAQGQVWSAFIHPLSSLTSRDFVSGVAQVVNLKKTYGTTFSSGALVFGGGDSQRLNRDLYEKIMRKGGIEI